MGSFGQENATATFNISIPHSLGGGAQAASASINAITPFYWSSGSGNLRAAQTAPGESADILPMTVGAAVGPSLDNFEDYGLLPGNFDGYIAFTFESNLGDHYGWVRATGNADGSEISLTEYAYETTPNTSILVVPEVSSLAMLALGAGGLSFYRRRKAA